MRGMINIYVPRDKYRLIHSILYEYEHRKSYNRNSKIKRVIPNDIFPYFQIGDMHKAVMYYGLPTEKPAVQWITKKDEKRV